MGKYKSTGRVIGRPSKQSDLETTILDMLSEGKQPAQTVIHACKNFSLKSIKRCKSRLGIESQRLAGCWYWLPPGQKAELTVVPPPRPLDQSDVDTAVSEQLRELAEPTPSSAPMTEDEIRKSTIDHLEGMIGDKAKVVFSTLLQRVITTVREYENGVSEPFTDGQIRQFTLDALDDEASHPTLAKFFKWDGKSFLSETWSTAPYTAWLRKKIVDHEQRASQPTFEEQVAKMSINEIEDNLDTLNDIDNLSEQSAKNREILRTRFAELCKHSSDVF